MDEMDEYTFERLNDREYIEGYPDYKISKYGEVTSFKEKFGCYEYLLKPQLIGHKDKNNLYYAVTLYKDKKPKQFSIARLVVNAYIPNLENKPTVDHIDRNKLNNRVDNLRWATYPENLENRIVPLGRTNLRYISKKTIDNIHYYRLNINNSKYKVDRCFLNLEDVLKEREKYYKI